MDIEFGVDTSEFAVLVESRTTLLCWRLRLALLAGHLHPYLGALALLHLPAIRIRVGGGPWERVHLPIDVSVHLHLRRFFPH